MVLSKFVPTGTTPSPLEEVDAEATALLERLDSLRERLQQEIEEARPNAVAVTGRELAEVAQRLSVAFTKLASVI